MENFNFYAPTKMMFGRGKAADLPGEMNPFGSRVLLVYGGGSIRKNGIYEAVCGILRDHGFTFFELSGVTPNPKIESVREGVRLARENRVDMVLAVGGGSVMDCAKMVAAGYFYEGDAWDLVMNASLIQKALPVFTIVTMSATGSEMNPTAVISDMKAHIKKGAHSDCLFPKASVLDPGYLYSLPAVQTAAGVADIMSHVFEGYFKKTEDAYVQDKFSEGVLKTCIKWGPVALTEPENYSARANIMWAASMALNGLCGCGKEGKWSCHAIQHQLGAYYDITHGAGLAILTPHWMRYVLNDDTVDKFYQYGVNVWSIGEKADKYAVANEAIDKTADYFKALGMPSTLTEVGIDDSLLPTMAKKAAARLKGAYMELSEDQVLEIFRKAL